jgi:type II secretory ATPase GspE/PulE/Tfp pilus assembly ATPase PilB-like protein
MITLTNDLRKALIQTRSLPEIGTQFRRAKMLYLQEQALRRVISGTVAINEMIRVLSTGKAKKQNK